MSFPRSVGQMPLYYNHKNTGRPGAKGADAGSVFWSHYGDEKNSPLYPFGYGLSYTEFEYSQITLNKPVLTAETKIEASITLTNRGKVKGKEVVQMYIRDHFASVTRPVRELKDFELVELEPGESKLITFELTPETLQFYSVNKKWESEPGTFSLFIGTNSATSRRADFKLE
jgi:beta-glucosidase